MKKFIFAFLAFILTLIVIPTHAITANATNENNLIIRAYGDSISYGETLANLNDAYPAVFSEKYVNSFNAEFIAKGVSGDTSSDLLEDLEPYKNNTATDMQNFIDTDIITLCIGANNILGSSLSNLTSFLTGSISEAQMQALLDAGVNQFKEDYPQILEIFENKQIVVMTIYNPYKYLSLTDIQIDSSVSADNAALINSLILSYETKLQKLITMSINSLQIINDEIRASESNNICVVDIYNLFNTFTENEYLSYINADISKVTITNSDIEQLLNFNISGVMSKISNSCDPHPTKEGHAKIAEKHNSDFKGFNISTSSLENVNKAQNITLTIDSVFNYEFVYKIFKEKDSNIELLATTSANTIEIAAEELEGKNKLFIEVYKDNTLFETTNKITTNVVFKTEPTSNYLPLIIGCSVAGIAIVAIAIFVIKKKKRHY